VTKKYWEIDEAKIHASCFFHALWRHFGDATSLYVEGNSISGDVKRLLLRLR